MRSETLVGAGAVALIGAAVLYKRTAAPAEAAPVEAAVISGTKIAATIRAEVGAEVEKMVASTGLRPGLAVLIVGDRVDSKTYVRNKHKAAKDCGFYSVDVELPASTSTEDIIAAVTKLNADDAVHGKRIIKYHFH